jgi:hypothetical protein
MEAVATTRRSSTFVVACLLATAACSGDDTKSGGTMTTPDASKPVVDSGVMTGDDSSVTPPGDDSSTPMADAGHGRPKDIGSPCMATTDCRPGLTCDTTIAGGMCTEACMMDADCVANSRTTSACVDMKCYATCMPTAAGEGGVVDMDGGEAGAPKAPCKNKAFDCVASPAGGAAMVCMPGDAGTTPGDDSGTGDDGSTTNDSSTPAEGGSEAGASDATTE